MLARQQVMRKQTTTEKFVIQRLQTAPLLGKNILNPLLFIA